MSKLTFKTDDDAWFDVLAPSGKDLGSLYQLEDGCFYFFPDSSGHGWSPWVLRQIADKLDELNKPWEDYINETFKP